MEQLWGEFAHAHVPETQKGMRINFAAYLPVLNTQTLDKISLTVQSEIQKSQFEEIRQRIEHYISQRVAAPITLEITADKKTESGTKPYTPKEKLERLIEKNPAIKKMQQEIGLELDYD